MRFHFFIKASFIVDTLQCCSKVGFIGGGSPITRAEGASCQGVRGHAPPEDFEI